MLALLALTGMENSARAAGGAFVVDDVEIAKPGDCKVESWVQGASNHDFAAVSAPACVVQLGIPVELTTQFNRTRSADTWQTSVDLKGKVNIVPVATGKVGVGFVGSFNWATSNGQYLGNFLYVPLTYQMTDDFRINLNAGWLYDGMAMLHSAYWGAGFEWNFVKPVTLIGELFGFYGNLPTDPSNLGDGPRALREPRLQTGLRFTPQNKFDIDVIYGHNINGENAHWLTLGLNVRF